MLIHNQIIIMEKANFIKIEAIQIAEVFNIKKLRAEFGFEPHSSSPSEIFYTLTDKKRYLYIFDYGVVVLANYTITEKKEFIDFVKNYASTIVDLDLLEEYQNRN